MNEITNDLQDLANITLPPKDNPLGRNLVKFTIACFAVLVLVCVLGIGFALRASLTREDAANARAEALAKTNECVRASSYEYDDAVGNAVKLLVDLNVPITEGLAAFGRDDLDGLQAALAHADESVAASASIKTAIDRAVEARRTALDEC